MLFQLPAIGSRKSIFQASKNVFSLPVSPSTVVNFSNASKNTFLGPKPRMLATCADDDDDDEYDDDDDEASSLQGQALYIIK